METESRILIAGCANSTIPTDGSVKRIGEGAFEGGESLTSIRYGGTKKQWKAMKKYGWTDPCTVHCKDGDAG